MMLCISIHFIEWTLNFQSLNSVDSSGICCHCRKLLEYNVYIQFCPSLSSAFMPNSFSTINFSLLKELSLANVRLDGTQDIPVSTVTIDFNISSNLIKLSTSANERNKNKAFRRMKLNKSLHLRKNTHTNEFPKS